MAIGPFKASFTVSVDANGKVELFIDDVTVTPTGSATVPSASLPAPSSSLPAPSSSLPAPSSSLPAPSSSLPVPSSSLPAPSSSLPAPSGSDLWVSAYYAGWFPDMLPESRIDYSAMTHLFIGRATVSTNTGGVRQALDVDNTRGMNRAKAMATACRAAGKKSVLMLGGVGEGVNFSASATAANRSTFVTNILAFLDATGIDGVDLDWEENINWNDFLALCQALRAARPGMIIAIPLAPVNMNIGLSAAQRTFLSAVHPFVDQINLMSYGIGMAGPWGGWVTWHTGALLGHAANRPTSIASSLGAMAAAGVPKKKLGMGIGFYGINFGVPNTDPYQTPGSSYDSDDVTWRYNQVIKYVTGKETTNRKWDDAAKMNYMSFPGGFNPNQPGFPGGNLTAGFLSYEDERSISEKGAWCKANGYGGTIIWVINYACTNPSTGANPLLAATKAAFL